MSSGPASADRRPTFAAYPLVKARAEGRFTRSAATCSTSTWASRPPATTREAPEPDGRAGGAPGGGRPLAARLFDVVRERDGREQHRLRWHGSGLRDDLGELGAHGLGQTLKLLLRGRAHDAIALSRDAQLDCAAVHAPTIPGASGRHQRTLGLGSAWLAGELGRGAEPPARAFRGRWCRARRDEAPRGRVRPK